MRTVSALSIALLALVLVLTGCDEDEETIVLDDPNTPTTSSFTFEYNRSDVDNGVVIVTSEENDTITNILQEFGFARGDVVDARVSAARMARITAPSVRPKVFDYLGSVEVSHGSSPSDPLVALRSPIDDTAEQDLDVVDDADITSVVQNGATPLTMELQVDDASQVPESGDEVRITLTYRLEVQE